MSKRSLQQLKVEIEAVRGSLRNSNLLANEYLRGQQNLESRLRVALTSSAAWRKVAQDLMDENVELKRSKLHIPIEITHGSNPRG